MGEKEKKKVNRDENGLAHNFKSIHLRLLSVRSTESSQTSQL